MFPVFPVCCNCSMNSVPGNPLTSTKFSSLPPFGSNPRRMQGRPKHFWHAASPVHNRYFQNSPTLPPQPSLSYDLKATNLSPSICLSQGDKQTRYISHSHSKESNFLLDLLSTRGSALPCSARAFYNGSDI